jgi:hypothetical protein
MNSNCILSLPFLCAGHFKSDIYKQPSCTRKYSFQNNFSDKDASRTQTTHVCKNYSQILRNLQFISEPFITRNMGHFAPALVVSG